jgi:hypothetical protein
MSKAALASYSQRGSRRLNSWLPPSGGTYGFSAALLMPRRALWYTSMIVQ